MSTDANADAREGNAGEGYDEMLETLDVAIQEAKQKVESGRVYKADNEKVRIKWIRALAYAVNVRRQVTNDRDLQELAERIQAIEEAQGVADGA